MGDAKEYTSVPTSDLTPQAQKYHINSKPRGIIISKLVCFLLTLAALFLAAVAALAVFIFIPGCSETPPEALTTKITTPSTSRKAVDVQQRLPGSIYPTHYIVQLIPFFDDGNFTTHGFVSIMLRVNDETDKILINLSNITVDFDSIRVKYIENDVFLRIVDTNYNREGEIYTIILDRNLLTDGTYKLDMQFEGYLDEHLQGFYRTEYFDTTSNYKKWMASTQFAPTDARKAFPCFDEPQYKATFNLSVARPENMTSLSNMPKINSEKSTEVDHYVWDYYKTTPKISTYLLAIIVSDLQPYEFNHPDRLYSIWARKDVINHSVYASNVAPKMLAYFERYFDSQFPLPKMDMVAVPDLGYPAMENWGLITFREETLLVDGKTASMDDRRDAMLMLAHQLAHQWFGNLVTMRWWSDVWMKEGFATYFSYFATNHVEPSWNITQEFSYSLMDHAIKLDALPSTPALTAPVESAHQIRQQFNAIATHKGACLVRMMQHMVGADEFKQSCGYFLSKFQYGSIEHDDFLGVFKERTLVSLDGLTMKDVMDEWINKAGFPLVNAMVDYEKHELKLSQARFLIYPTEDAPSTPWHIPLSFATSNTPNFDATKPHFWLHDNETAYNISTNTRWYLLNLKQTAYCIVNYDATNWKRLISNLMDFPPDVRAQLLSDSFDLARANLLDYDIPLKMLVVIGRRDNHLIPYLTAFRKVEYMHNMMIQTPIFAKFDIYLLAVFNAAFDNTNFNENPSDSYAMVKLRKEILKWACKRPDSRCVIQSRHAYRAWMTTLQPVSSNIRSIVYCTAIREGGAQEWDFAYQQYLKTNLASEKRIILESLGCSSKTWILSRYLSFILNPNAGVRKQDANVVFHSVADNIVGNSLAFDFLRTNWDRLTDYLGDGFTALGRMIESLGGYMNSKYHIQQFETFRSENNVAATSKSFNIVIDTIRANMFWMNQSYPSIEMWLNDHNEHFGI